jgi:hypothetical protein
MNWNKTSQLLQVGSNIGILLGLVLVGIQIFDTNRIATAQFIADDYAFTMSSWDLKIGENLPESWSRAEQNSPDLTFEDMTVINSYLFREWFRSMRDRDIARTGLKSIDTEFEAIEWTYGNLGNETALRWWAFNYDGVLAQYPELRDAISERVRLEGDAHSQSLLRVREIMQEGDIFPN